MFPFLLAVAENPGQDESGGIGLLMIALVLLLIVLVIGSVWTFVAKRGSKVPRRDPGHGDHVGH